MGEGVIVVIMSCVKKTCTTFCTLITSEGPEVMAGYVPHFHIEDLAGSLATYMEVFSGLILTFIVRALFKAFLRNGDRKSVV